jgi:hypothetical protein
VFAVCQGMEADRLEEAGPLPFTESGESFCSATMRITDQGDSVKYGFLENGGRAEVGGRMTIGDSCRRLGDGRLTR